MAARQYRITQFLLILANFGFAQNPQLEFRNSLVVYNLTTFDRTWAVKPGTGSHRYHFTYSNLQVLHPTIAFRWRSKKHNLHEVELTRMSMGSNGYDVERLDSATGNKTYVGGNVIVSTDIAARYEFIRTFFKNKDIRLLPALGFALLPGFNRTIIGYHSAASFPIVLRTLNLQAQLVPRLTWFMRKRLFFDFNIPLTFINMEQQIQKQLDPSVSVEDQKIVSFNFEGLPMTLSARIGIGIKF